MIKAVHFPRFRTGETIQFIYDTLKLGNSMMPLGNPLANSLNLLNAANQKLDNAFKLDQGSAISSQVETLDLDRGSALNGCKCIVEGYTYHYDVTIVKAAELVLKSIEKYGPSIARQNYQQETSTINSILDSWENDSQLKSAIALLKLTDWATHLRTTNNKFNDAYINRVKEQGNKTKTNTEELVKEVVVEYKKLVKVTEANLTLNPSLELQSFVNEMNFLVERYNLMVDSRVTAEPVATPSN